MEGRFVLQGDSVVLDRQTGLAWQRGASTDRMVWNEGFGYIKRLNAEKFCGFSDWRFPTEQELETLILSEEERSTGLYLHSLFGTQRNCWSSTEGHHHEAVYVDYYYGDAYLITNNYANHFIRAVRTPQGKKGS